ncbi:MAG TPA: hypothetical protein VHD87_12615 [Acidimicrobiales bacterium]|nr:hypothetical protein [Acidimicrobiales bacterium]
MTDTAHNLTHYAPLLAVIIDATVVLDTRLPGYPTPGPAQRITIDAAASIGVFIFAVTALTYAL